MRVWVLGLTDVGRSPRLQNHAVSLAQQADCTVDVIAQAGNTPSHELLSHPKIFLHYIPTQPSWVNALPTPWRLVFKAVIQAWLLFILLFFRTKRPDVILLQVPPSIPTIFLGWFVSRCRGSRLIIDWHNFGFTLMAIGKSASSPLVRVAEWHEKFWGRQADAHLCVSRAMKAHLASDWGINAVVFHDKPLLSFIERTGGASRLQKTHSLFGKLDEAMRSGLHPRDTIAAFLARSKGGSATICTEVVGGEVRLRDDRPAVVVTSTSWTPDEDVGLLVEAAQLYEQAASSGRLPKLLVLITGKGPQKEFYLGNLRTLSLRHVAFRTLWLASEDYPILLASADLGISLHYSSSGLDLPMKEGRNGWLFSNAAGLCQHLKSLFLDFPARQSTLLTKAQNSVRAAQQQKGSTWESCWEDCVLPVITERSQ